MLVKFQLNGDPIEVNLEAGDRLLVDVLREDLRLTGAPRLESVSSDW
jgi:aerobic-type carbon monoxide dehydrogenase small subunit (CoxS/CutS family)